MIKSRLNICEAIVYVPFGSWTFQFMSSRQDVRKTKPVFKFVKTALCRKENDAMYTKFIKTLCESFKSIQRVQPYVSAGYAIPQSHLETITLQMLQWMMWWLRENRKESLIAIRSWLAHDASITRLKLRDDIWYRLSVPASCTFWNSQNSLNIRKIPPSHSHIASDLHLVYDIISRLAG